MTRISVPFVATLLLLLTVVPVGCGGGGAGAGSSDLSTPESTFESAKGALDRKDFETFTECLDEESVDVMAGTLAMGAVMLKEMESMASGIGDFAGKMGGDMKKEVEKKFEDAKAKVAEVEKTLEKYGIDENMVKGLNPAKLDVEACKKVVAHLTDRAAFIGEMMSALEKVGDERAMNPVDGELVDLTIDGDTASATILTRKNGAENREAVQFIKSGDGWKMKFDLSGLSN